MHVPSYSAAQCITKSDLSGKSELGFGYDIKFVDECNVIATMKIQSTPSCQFRMDVCRTLELLRGNVAPLWDGLALGSHWEEARLQGPTFLQQLPQTFKLSGVNARGLKTYQARARHSAKFQTFGTCAVVGGAPSLLRGSYGTIIDGHDAVFRFNDHSIHGKFSQHTGTKTTVRILQNARDVSSSSALLSSNETVVQIVIRNKRALLEALKDKHEKTLVYNPDSMLAFHQSFLDEVGGTGPLGVWLSLLLCAKSPTVFGFSQLGTNLSRGFEHYYRGSYGEKMLGDPSRPGQANVLHAVIWLHVLSCLRLIELAPV